MKRCVIIASGPIGDTEPLMKMIQPDDFILCVDGGYDHAARMGLRPDLLIGDLDSLKSELPEGLEVLRFKKEKDETDTILAIDYALENGFRDFLILGGLKGRLDHTFANFSTLYYLYNHGGRCFFADADNRAYLLPEGEMRIKRLDGYYLSLFPFCSEALGVCESGVKYPLDDARLQLSFPLGVSNEFAAEEAVIYVKKGPLLIILSKE